MIGSFLAIYGILFGCNEILSNMILNRVIDDINYYFDLFDIELEGINKLVIDALIQQFIEEVSTSRTLDYFPFISVFINIKNLYFLNEDIKEFLMYLEACYNYILYGPTIKSEKIEEVKPKKLQNKYFISLNYQGKLATIWFKYEDSKLEIISVSPVMESLSMRDVYKILLNVLGNIKEGRNKLYNYSNGLEEYIKNLDITKEQEELVHIRKI